MFSEIKEAEISEFLSTILKQNVLLALAIGKEKACSELIIINLLLEIKNQFNVSFFSGIDFTVDKEKGLNGFCDFKYPAINFQVSVDFGSELKKSPFFSVPPGRTCGACRAAYGRKSRKTFGQLLIISKSPEQLFLDIPVLAVVEAKNEKIVSGLGQCVAEMIAAKIYNEREGNALPCIYGAVTTGHAWKFLKLEEDTAYIDI
ncbi:hypothetical protein [Desulfonema magnum]|uniref:hypothetical protein n=1 Tax=Desulfonema magnum TaxID=45655 RepID=UPI001A9B25D7|nr:hypothetical protein [Desulfonema magnum]